MKTHKQKVIQAYQEWEMKYVMKEGIMLTIIVNVVVFTLVILLSHTKVADTIDNIHPVIEAYLWCASFLGIGYYLKWGRK